MRQGYPNTFELMRYNMEGTMLLLRGVNVCVAFVSTPTVSSEATNVIDASHTKDLHTGEHEGDVGPKVWEEYKQEIQEALKRCNDDERLEPAREDIANIFHRVHFEKFPTWPRPGDSQTSIVNVNSDGSYKWPKAEVNTQNRFFIVWACEGMESRKL